MMIRMIYNNDDDDDGKDGMIKLKMSLKRMLMR